MTKSKQLRQERAKDRQQEALRKPSPPPCPLTYEEWLKGIDPKKTFYPHYEKLHTDCPVCHGDTDKCSIYVDRPVDGIGEGTTAGHPREDD